MAFDLFRNIKKVYTGIIYIYSLKACSPSRLFGRVYLYLVKTVMKLQITFDVIKFEYIIL